MKIEEAEFFLWAAAAVSGFAMGSALVLSSTPVVGAYIGAVMPLIIAVTALITSQKNGESEDRKQDRLLVVTKFVFAFFVSAIIATVVGFFIRPTDSIISNINRDLKILGMKENERVSLIKNMLQSGKLGISASNTRPEGFVLYNAPNTPVGSSGADVQRLTLNVDCAAFPSPPWNPEIIGQMSIHQGGWREVGQTLTEVERIENLNREEKTTVHRAIYGLVGC